MGNSRSNYKRHEDDEQQQRIVIGKEFRLVLGQLNLTKQKKILLNTKQQNRRKLSSSSSNSTITSSSSSDNQNSSVSLIQFDIPTSPLDSNEFDIHALIQYLFQQQSNGKELSHIFQIPFNHKTQLKTFPTLQIAAIYYEQSSTTINQLNIESISLFYENELEQKIQKFNEKNILSIYTSSLISLSLITFLRNLLFLESTAYIIYTKNLSIHKKYKLIRSTTMLKTTLENFEWLQPFIDYSNLGYRLCGIISYNNSPLETSFTIYWLFEQIETNERIPYDYCLIEYQLKTFSLNSWISLLNLMSKQEWKLVSTFNYNEKKKNHGEQIYFLLFFQRLKIS
jgi:hypothetical protein